MPLRRGRNQTQMLTTLRNAIDENRIDIFLQPMVTLPQRKVRFYEAVTRVRDEREQLIAAEEFISIAEASGLIGRILLGGEYPNRAPAPSCR